VTEASLDKAGNDLTSDEVFIISSPISIAVGWACAPKHLTLEQVQEQLLNDPSKDYIPGHTPWTVAPREHADPDFQSPGRCGDHPDRQHWCLIGGLTGVVMLKLADDCDGFPEGLTLQRYDEEEADD
jgi:hypothetical protein